MYNYYSTMSSKDSNSKLSVTYNNIKMTIGNVIRDFIDGKLGNGFKFKYKEEVFVVDDNKIKHLWKVEDIDTCNYDIEYDLFDFLSTKELLDDKETVEILEYVLRTSNFGITSYDYDNITMSSCTHTKSNAVLCPVCNGRGTVPRGFYDSVSGIYVTSTTTPDCCRSCNGKGYLKI